MPQKIAAHPASFRFRQGALRAAGLALAAALLVVTRGVAQAPAPTGTLRFLVVGDWGRQGSFHQRETAEQMGRTASAVGDQFVVATGDNIYDDGVDSVRDSLWKKSFEDIYTAPSLQIPWYVALGNHDYHTNPQAEVEYTLFSPRWKMPDRYYTVTLQVTPTISAEFFITDTSPFITSYYTEPKYAKVKEADPKAQLAWLEKQLAASKAQWKFVVGHHTIYSSGTKHGDSLDLIKTFKPLMEKYGVQAYLNGHDHDMEAIHEGAIFYLTSGAGSEVRGELKPEANSLFANGTSSGYMSVALTAESFDYQFIDWQGKMLFQGKFPRVPAATGGK
jgi:tartrate-resistant acid phosphatase type 5